MAEEKQSTTNHTVTTESGIRPGAQDATQPAQPYAQFSRPPKRASPARLRFLSAAALVLLAVSGGFLGGWLSGNGADQSSTVEEQQVVLKSQGQLISDIADKVGESVVSIEVTSTSQPVNSFFGFQGSTEQESAGTGIIIDKDGLIITNRHVIPDGTTNVNVTMSDGTKFEGVEVVGRTRDSDPLDIAFLKIKDTNGKELKAATIGDSSSMKVGDSVVAIGNALGQFQNTVTSGIISGFGRSVQASDESGSDTENLENLFQTDAAINAGNSGGPLVNLEGKVIGINTAVAAGDAQNIGFAIPINDVKSLIKSVSEKGTLERPFLGVIYIPITADIAKQYDLDTEQGAYVPPSVMVGEDAVIDGSAADVAGIKENDILTKINDEAIDEKHSLTSLLGKYEVGDKVKITLMRDGKERTVEVTLQAAPEN